MFFLYFIPKINLYYALEEQLHSFDITLSDEALVEHPFSLEIKNPTIALKAVKTAEVSQISINPFLFFNTITAKNITLNALVKTYAPQKIQEVTLHYTLLNPLHITADAQGDFGKATIDYALTTSHLELVLKPSQEMLTHYRNSLRELKKQKNGEYIYAKNF